MLARARIFPCGKTAKLRRWLVCKLILYGKIFKCPEIPGLFYSSVEGNHPRDEKGRIVSKGYQRVANSKEISSFLNKATTSNDFQKITMARIKEETKNHIKDLTGNDLKRIVVDTCSVKHSLKKDEHFIDTEDFKKIPSIVNKTKSVSLEAKNHFDNKVIKFTEEKENGLIIIMEVRAKKGELALITMYRQKKSR